MTDRIFLIDYLRDAEITAPSENYVEIQRMNQELHTRSAIFQHPDSSIRFPEFSIGKKPVLMFETGIAESVRNRFQGKVLFTIKIISDGKEDIVHESSLHTKDNPSGYGWHPFLIDLATYEDRSVELIFETSVEGPAGYAWSAWANPVLESEKTAAKTVVKPDKHHHLVVITADAMSKRFFGCYGSEDVKTPNIDRMAGESIVFENAWSNSTTTPGSYATLWSGLHPENHKLDSEWGPYPAGVMSLPEYFNGKGYHTAMFSSEAELSHDKFGFSGLFNEVHGAIANPAQDGAVTVRNFGRWLSSRPDKPLLCWLQFFDTHPPNLPPENYTKKYYEGDPTSVEDGHKDVQGVFGIETLVEFNRSLPLIRQGKLPAQPYHRFMETVRAFKGEQKTGPDLHEHLTRMKPEVRLGLSDYKFGCWLEKQVKETREKGTADPEFIKWIELVQKELEFVQEGIISWLKGVRDFNFPISQYKACMAYFDELVGNVIKTLKDQGIYDQTTIVLVSPHGEILKYDDAIFHHHFPHPNVLSIPMIIKTSGQNKTGRIDGVTDLMDLAPTLIELFGFENIFKMDGESRAENINERKAIDNDHSIGYDLGNALFSVAQPPYFYYRAIEDYIITPTKFGKKGEEYLYRLTGDERGLEPLEDEEILKQELGAKLDAFLDKS